MKPYRTSPHQSTEPIATNPVERLSSARKAQFDSLLSQLAETVGPDMDVLEVEKLANDLLAAGRDHCMDAFMFIAATTLAARLALSQSANRTVAPMMWPTGKMGDA